MKKFTLAFCLLISIATLCSAEIKFLDNPTWSSVLAQAKKENKVIFFDAYAVWCGPCKKMDAETYTDQAVADYYNANFINVKYDMEKGEGLKLAEKFNVTAYPSLLFINADGELLHKGLGFQGAADFVSLGKTAANPKTQYFTLKNGALDLSNADFMKFAQLAVEFEDEELAMIAQKYIAKQPDVLANEDLVDALMNFVNVLPDEKTLAYVFANKNKLLTSGKYSQTDVDEHLVTLTLGYAISANTIEEDNTVDLKGVKRIVDQYSGDKAFFIYHYFATQYEAEMEAYGQAMVNFNLLLNAAPDKVKFSQLCNAFMSFSDILVKQGKLEESLTKLDAFELSEQEKGSAYLKDMVRAVSYLKAKEVAKFNVVADKMIAASTTPNEIKEQLKRAKENAVKQ